MSIRYNLFVELSLYTGKIAAMVSGGMDSMVMLDMMQKKGADLLVVHVNHGIRKNAYKDCEFVKAYCEKNNIPFIGYCFDVPTLAKASGRSIETEARLARRKVIDEILSKYADKVALAHHADDNAETVLMHIFRGSGPDGLTGIRQTDRIIRPLLSYTKNQIEEYARRYGISYVTDETNFDPYYTRNFIRLKVLPLIKSRFPSAVETLNRLALNMTETLYALDSQLDMRLITVKDDVVELSLEALESPLAARYVVTAAKKLMPVDVTRAQIVGVIKLFKSQNGSKAELAGGLKAYRDYDKITFCFDKNVDDFCVPFREGLVELSGGYIATVSRVDPKPIKGKTVVSSIPKNCVFRHRRSGDRFTPYGGGEKSLKKYLIDKKVPRRLRNELVCLCNEDEVLAIIGMEISDKCKVKDGEAYLIEVTKKE